MPRSFTDYCLPQYFSSFASMRAVLLLCSLPFSLLFHLEFKLFYFQLSQLLNLDFPGSSNGKESACNAGDQGSIPGLGRSPEEEKAPTPIFLPGQSHGQRSLGYSPSGRKGSETTERLSTHTQISSYVHICFLWL